MSRPSYENLEVYQMAEALADAVWDVVRRWDGFARQTVGSQLVRAADSVGANIAEGAGRGTGPDRARFVRIARGSLYETRYWLRRAQSRDLLAAEQVEHLRPLLDQFPKRLNSYLKSIR